MKNKVSVCNKIFTEALFMAARKKMETRRLPINWAIAEQTKNDAYEEFKET